jgi:hypothetical protein
MNRDSRRIPLLALAILALLAALWAGWIRIGWNWPALQPGLIAAHGPLMVCGFLGTLIALERAIALHRSWMYVAPLLSGIGSMALILGFSGLAAKVLITAGSLVMVLIFYIILRQHMAPYTVVMALGSAAWLIGNLLWIFNWPVFRLVPWWMGFLVLTIAGERLELGRLRRLSPAVTSMFYGSIGIFLLGLLVSLWSAQAGIRLAGLGMLALAVWLGRYDIARRTIRQKGLPRFAATSLLTGYFWLGVGGVMALVYGAFPAGPAYDAILHSVFVGFVMAMIFGHAPIVFPAVLGLPVRYSWSYYIPLALLNVSVALRILGDILLIQPLRMWGGLLNGVSILIFLIMILVYSVVFSNRELKESRDIISDG